MRSLAIAFFMTLLAVPLSGVRADDQADLTELLLRSEATVRALAGGGDQHSHLDQLKQLLPEARAVVITPRLIKAGFIVGGEYGDSVLMARRTDESWGYPAFYTMGGGGIGLQIGIKDSQIMFVIRTEKGLKALMEDQFTLGADASVTVGTVGAGMSADSTTNVGVDILAFSLDRGAFGGGSLDGTVFAKRSDWNQTFYGQTLTPQQIVLEGQGSNPIADNLRSTLAQFSASN